jgi:beta-glucosidase
MANIKKVLASLTIDEKIGQLAQLPPFFFIKDLKKEVSGPLAKLSITEEQVFSAGSVLGIGGPEEMKQVQDAYLAKSTHKIPLMFMADVIHGYKTIFPVPLAIASSWNPSLAKLASKVAAAEASSSGIHVTYAPMADLSRDPRWGRVMEGYGEDGLLAYRMAFAMTEGFQGESLLAEDSIAACVKHFAAYGAVEAGREYNTVDISRYALFNYFLKGYQGAIDAGARLVMTSFNTFEGKPATTNEYLLRHVLREFLNFKGVVISDYDSALETIEHRTSLDQRDVANQAIKAGLDIEMASTTYLKHLKQLIQDKVVPLKLLDEAVLRVLELKNDLGLFENPYKSMSVEKEKSLVYSHAHMDAALKVSLESIVLLKNANQTLPLKKGVKIALLGSHHNTGQLLGPWSWHGDRTLTQTIQSAMTPYGVYFSSAVEDLEQYSKEDLRRLKKADVIVLCTGELESMSGEAHSRANPVMFKHQTEFIKQLKAFGIPIVLVLVNGRPIVLTEVVSHVDAIVETYFLGTQSALAITKTLFGENNPSGKLTMSFPRSVGQIPLYYNHLNTGRPFNGDKKSYTSFYLDEDNEPLFPFGFGLSYTQFQYGTINVSSSLFTPKKPLVISLLVKNAGLLDGFETVQLYVSDLKSEVALPVRELKDFKKVWIKKGKVEKVEFTLTVDQLKYVHSNGDLTWDEGEFVIAVGSSSVHLKSVTVALKKDSK